MGAPPRRISPADATPFGKYLLFGPIGQGGMAEVVLARPFAQRRLVAIKLIRQSLSQSKTYVDMFVREGNLAIRLNNDAIVKTYEIGRIQKRHFICMEYISGIDLSQFLKRLRGSARRRLPVPHALSIVLRICEALHYAHELRDDNGAALNIVNRDVSPANIRLSFEGDVKLLDFGIAKAMSGLSSEIGVFKGKVSYMSPEQVRGLPLDRRSDIFSTAIVLHEILTQERLFRAESEFQSMDIVRRAEVPPPSALNPRLPKEVDHIVLTALQKDPLNRYQTAGEMANEIRGVLGRYNFNKSELREYIREVCHDDWLTEQTMIEECLQWEAPEPPPSRPAEEDYGELVVEFDSKAPADVQPAPRRTSRWLYVLLGLTIALLAAAVLFLLFFRGGRGGK